MKTIKTRVAFVAVGLAILAGLMMGQDPSGPRDLHGPQRAEQADPRNLLIRDEFHPSGTAYISGAWGELGWTPVNIAGTSVFGYATPEAHHPGLFAIQTGANASDGGAIA